MVPKTTSTPNTEGNKEWYRTSSAVTNTTARRNCPSPRLLHFPIQCFLKIGCQIRPGWWRKRRSGWRIRLGGGENEITRVKLVVDFSRLNTSLALHVKLSQHQQPWPPTVRSLSAASRRTPGCLVDSMASPIVSLQGNSHPNRHPSLLSKTHSYRSKKMPWQTKIWKPPAGPPLMKNPNLLGKSQQLIIVQLQRPRPILLILRLHLQLRQPPPITLRRLPNLFSRE